MAEENVVNDVGEDRQVSLTVEKFGFRLIKVSRLLKQELGWSLDDIMNGGGSEYMPLSRARQLKAKFEAAGMAVSIEEIPGKAVTK